MKKIALILCCLPLNEAWASGKSEKPKHCSESINSTQFRLSQVGGNIDMPTQKSALAVIEECDLPSAPTAYIKAAKYTGGNYRAQGKIFKSNIDAISKLSELSRSAESDVNTKAQKGLLQLAILPNNYNDESAGNENKADEIASTLIKLISLEYFLLAIKEGTPANIKEKYTVAKKGGNVEIAGGDINQQYLITVLTKIHTSVKNFKMKPKVQAILADVTSNNIDGAVTKITALKANPMQG